MDRQTVYPGQIPLETDLLNTNKNTMMALGKLAAAILGTSNNIVNGLAVVPTSPASLSVNVNPGEIYSLQSADATAYSSLPVDTTSVVKQGLQLQASALSCPAPTTAGFSINYLIEATYQDSDTGMVTLPYYNATNPSQAWSGPNNSGTQQATKRSGIVALQAKAGVAAATGSQTTPAVDPGYVALAVVTVANGQSTITAGNITTLSSAQILTNSLLAMIQAAVPLTQAVASFTPTVGSGRNISAYLSAAASSVSITADQIVVSTALNGQTYVLSSFNKSVTLTTTGAGGMDTGSAPTSGYVAIYAIYNPTTQASALLAVNATSAAAANVYGGANMPSGYTASALVAVWPTDGTGKFIVAKLNDRRLSIAQKVAFTTTTGQVSLTSLSISSSIPPNAKRVSGITVCACTNGSATLGTTIASDASNTGSQNSQVFSNSSTSQQVSGNYGVDLATPQTIYYTFQNGSGTSPSLTIYVTAYEI